jgi:hypothetical protein
MTLEFPYAVFSVMGFIARISLKWSNKGMETCKKVVLGEMTQFQFSVSPASPASPPSPSSGALSDVHNWEKETKMCF